MRLYTYLFYIALTVAINAIEMCAYFLRLSFL